MIIFDLATLLPMLSKIRFRVDAPLRRRRTSGGEARGAGGDGVGAEADDDGVLPGRT
jgi:hypothetical protein